MPEMDRRSALVSGLAAVALASDARAQSTSGSSAEQRLRELGIELPKVRAPVANYVPAARMGNYLFSWDRAGQS